MRCVTRLGLALDTAARHARTRLASPGSFGTSLRSLVMQQVVDILIDGDSSLKLGASQFKARDAPSTPPIRAGTLNGGRCGSPGHARDGAGACGAEGG